MKKIYIYSIISFLFGVAFFILRLSNSPNEYFQKISAAFNKTLFEKEQKTKDEIDLLIKSFSTNENFFSSQEIVSNYSDLHTSEGISFIVYKNKEAAFWSDNTVNLPYNFENDPLLKGIILIDNGYYRIVSKSAADIKVIGLINIKNKYKYTNKYLSNNFHPSFSVPENTELSYISTGFDITDAEGNYLCSLDFSEVSKIPIAKKYFLLLFFIICVFFIIALLQALSLELSKRLHSALPLVIFPLFILLLRYLQLHFKFPSFLSSFEIFTPRLYAFSTTFPSYGDLLINIVIILYLAFYFSKHLLKDTQIINMGYKKIAYWIVTTLVFVFLSGNYLIELFKNLLYNSDISFDISNFLELSRYSFLGFILIGILMLSFFLLLSKPMEIIGKTRIPFYRKIILIAVSFLLFILISFTLGIQDISYYVFSFLTTSFIFFINEKGAKISRFYYSIILLFLFSIFTTYNLNLINTDKEKTYRKSIAVNLSIEHDPITEYAYMDIEGKIQQDTLLKTLLSEPVSNEEIIRNYLVKTYFKGHWIKYDILITVCRASDSLLIKPENVQLGCFHFFDEKLKIALPTFSCDLYYLDKGNSRISYISSLSFQDTIPNLASTKIFIEFDSKFAAKGLGYPELLMDKRVPRKIDLSKYSYAKFNNGILMSQFGKYLYNLKWLSNINPERKAEPYFVDFEDYNHLVNYIDENNILLVSKKNENWLESITPFSYMFSFYGIMVLIGYLFRHYPIRLKDLVANYKGRIQLSIMVIAITSLFIIGSVSLYFFYNQFNNKNFENLKERVHSVLTELETRIAKEPSLDESMSSSLNETLINLSNVFFTDINLFDTDGNLLASSRGKIFEEGLISNKINPIAYRELTVNNNSLFLLEENIGSMKFLSAYAPFRNYLNETTGYLNLPYFSKQQDLKNELSSFIVAIINIYVFIFGLALIVALFLSRYITRPLKLLKARMALVRLGEKNETISWGTRDEIGSLIEEYNRMVGELLRSAELLAKSERESAWKEMARQVAHEIKNPLTPMKLSVQHLERAWKEKAPDWDERLRKFTATMIEQIETLSNIASAFSDFARLPVPQIEQTSLNESIENIIQLYQLSEKIKLIEEFDKAKPYFVKADKKLLIQALNNVVKNAIQSVPDERDGEIFIRILDENEYYTIEIDDNGSGINEEVKEKIFSPYFTTKSGGTGLGLAMVKSIVESCGGKVGFKTKKIHGTIFFLKLQKFSPID